MALEVTALGSVAVEYPLPLPALLGIPAMTSMHQEATRPGVVGSDLAEAEKVRPTRQRLEHPVNLAG